jgi:hypothetical protein
MLCLISPVAMEFTEQGQNAPAFKRGMNGPSVLTNNQPMNSALPCVSSLAPGQHGPGQHGLEQHGVGCDPEKLPASVGGDVTKTLRSYPAA